MTQTAASKKYLNSLNTPTLRKPLTHVLDTIVEIMPNKKIHKDILFMSVLLHCEEPLARLRKQVSKYINILTNHALFQPFCLRSSASYSALLSLLRKKR